MEGCEEKGPEGIGESLNMFTRIERKAKSVRKVERVAERDVRVIGDVRPEIDLDSQRCRNGGGYPGQRGARWHAGNQRLLFRILLAPGLL